MAEYYPLLARAVAGLRTAPAEQRQAIYDRARHALLGQLRSMDPPVPEDSINRESTALDEAIARLEADVAVESAVAAAIAPAPTVADVAEPPDAIPEPAAPSVEAPEITVAERSTPLATPAIPAVPEPAATAAAPASSGARVVLPPVLPAGPAVTQAPQAPVVPPPMMPARVAPARPAAEALSRIVAERGPSSAFLRSGRAPDDGAARAETVVRPASPPVSPPPLPSAPRLEVPSFSDALVAVERSDEGPPAGSDAEPFEDLPPVASPGAEDEPLRPPAPRPVIQDRSSSRAVILATVALLVVAGIAYAAWRLRDRPESLARSQAAMLAAQQADTQNAAKVVTRADNGAKEAVPAPDAAAAPTSGAGVLVAPAAPTVAASPAPAATAAGPQAAAASPNAPAEGTATQADPSSGTASAPSTAAIAVAQRAAFLVDAPDEPSKIKTYVGTVVWSVDNASPVQDQPISRVVHAEVEVPEAGLKLAVVFQRNLEPQFPASHTLELRFTIQPGSTIGAVKQINVPQMRKDDSPSGDPLVGLPVTITDNYFLVGLSRGDAVQHNLELIRTRNWFDVPLLLTSGKVAKITFEKGTTGQQVIDDVLQSWQ